MPYHCWPVAAVKSVPCAGSQVGARAQALAVYLNKDAGLSHAKTARVLGQLGIGLTPGGSAQIMLRAALAAAHAHYVDELLAMTARLRSNAANECLAQHLYGHGEQWLTFLQDSSVPATNHRAEQALRGPIVNRKVWGGNRTPAGGDAQSIVSSTLATCKQQAVSFCQFLADTLRGLPRTLFGSTEPAPTALTAK
jgi:transposase